MSLTRGVLALGRKQGKRENPGWVVDYDELRSQVYFDGLRSDDQDFQKYLEMTGSFATIEACLNKLVALAHRVEVVEVDEATGERTDPKRVRDLTGNRWLFDRPNPGEGGAFFKQKALQQLAAAGNLVMWTDGPIMDAKDLYVAQFDRCFPDPNPSNQYPIAGWWYHANRIREYIDVEQTIYVRRPHPHDMIFGLSFVKQCEEALYTLWLTKKANKARLTSGSRLGGILRVSGMGGPERKKLEKMIESRRNVSRTGSYLVVDAQQVEFNADGITPQDMEEAMTTLEAKLEIYNVFGFMPALFATRDVNRSNLEEARKAAYTDVVIPFMDLYVEQVNHSPLMVAKGVRLEALYNELEELQGSQLEEAQAAALDLDRRVLTPNERREMLGKEPVEWGDEPILPQPAISMGFLPPGLEKNPEAAPAAPDPTGPADPDEPDDEEPDDEEAMANGNGRGKLIPPFAEQLVPRPAGERQKIVLDLLRASLPSREFVNGWKATRDNGGAPAEAVGCCRCSLESVQRIGARASTPDLYWRLVAERLMERETVWARSMSAQFGELRAEVLRNIREAAGALGRADSPQVPTGWSVKDWFDAVALASALTERMSKLAGTDLTMGYENAVGLMGGDTTLDLENAVVRQFLESRTASSVRNITETEVLAIREIIYRSAELGETVDQLARRINERFEFERGGRARMIARTETAALQTEGSMLGMEDNGVNEHEWLTSRDSDVRASHAAMEGVRVALRDSFRMTDPDTGAVATGPGPGQMSAAWANVNCYLPGTRVAGSFVAGVKSPYEGWVVELKTGSGKVLSVTPNHPVLVAGRGLVPAHSVAEGDHLICHEPLVDLSGGIDPEDGPPCIEEVYGALLKRGTVSSGVLAPKDLHGDAVRVKGNVEVVRLECELADAWNAPKAQGAEHLGLDPAAVGDPLHAGARAPDLPLHGISGTAAGIPGWGALAQHGSTSTLPDVPPLHALSIRPTPDLDALLNEVAPQGVPRDSGFVAELLQRGAGFVSVDQVVQVRNREFRGQVYDLQSETGLMVAEGVVASNCRCATAPASFFDGPRGARARQWCLEQLELQEVQT